MNDKTKVKEQDVIVDASKTATHMGREIEIKENLRSQDVISPNAIRQTPIEITPMVMMQMAIAEGSDVATMERLWALNEKVEAANSKKSYDFAMAKFKANPPQITKDKHVEFGNTAYDHASLGNVNEKIIARMGEYELSHKWDVKQSDKITVTCVITHSQGHSESVSLEASADTSGSIKGIQALASTISYLQRYTLLAATGLATSDMDDDGRGAEAPLVPPITEAQANKVYALLSDNGLDKEIFLGWLVKGVHGATTIEEIPITFLDRVIKKIEESIKIKNGKE